MPTHQEIQSPDVQLQPDDPSDKRVPVTEAIRYRKRAQSAEQQLQDAQQQLQDFQSQLEASQQTITALERRQKIDATLSESDAIDLEAARLLTEIAIESMDDPDVKMAVDDLRRHKPYLFRHRATASTMPAHLPDDADHLADRAAVKASTTGNRRDLLDYLRLRRHA